MSRTITTHHVNPANREIALTAKPWPWPDGPTDDCHHYEAIINSNHGPVVGFSLLFQAGPIAEKGVNGITNEALLAVVADRLECFQAGPFKCEENEAALACVRTALATLHMRTKKRMERGVEGTHTV